MKSIFLLLALSCYLFLPNQAKAQRNPELYKTISKLDSLYFSAYNTSNLKLLNDLTAENLEFYHDKGGLSASKKEVVESIQKNIFGKVKRVLKKGSMEVYEIHGFGAVEIGYHSFQNSVEQTQSEPSKFIIIWRLKDEQWQMTRVISLH